MTTNLARKLTIAGLAIAGVATSLAAVSAPSSAYADDGTHSGAGVLRSLDGGSTWEATHTYSKTLTFTLSTTNPGPAGGNVEFEWKVEEGESALIPVLLPIKYDNGVAPPESEDINIGVGELQECTISKPMDSTNIDLTRFAIDGTSAGERKYDYTWTVQSGRDAVEPIKEVSGLKMEQDVIEGAKGGNVEFEWKVEEGES